MVGPDSPSDESFDIVISNGVKAIKFGAHGTTVKAFKPERS
jgi:hypothetical protein